MTPMIDLNADLGEGAGTDDALFPLISSASVACGGHAGDSESMKRALAGCAEHGVVAGAHPSFIDRENFGRLRMDQPYARTAEEVVAQIGTLAEIAAGQGVALAYVKLHGALANMAAEDDALALAVFGAVQRDFPSLAVLAMGATAQERAAKHLSMRGVSEAYADRAYGSDGLLVSRTMPGAVITDPDSVVNQCVRLIRDREIVAIDGTVLPTRAQSICLHGDTPDAVALAQKISGALKAFASIASPLRS